MKHQEKKYQVDDFGRLTQKLSELGAHKDREGSSIHYYAVQAGNAVVKVVEHSGRCEVHMLKEADGKFTLTKSIPLKDVPEGLDWLKNHDYHEVAVVAMKHTDYNYKSGLVGLYVINDLLHSVILDFPAGEHATIAKELEIDDAELIEAPFNKFLAQQGKLESVKIEQLLLQL